VSSARVTYHPHPVLTSEQARDARARAWAWAFIFSCLRAKREDGSATIPDDPKVREIKEVNYVEHFSDETSSIAHYRFTKEKG